MKKVNDNPSIFDNILFELVAENATNLNDVKIYFLEKKLNKKFYDVNYINNKSSFCVAASDITLVHSCNLNSINKNDNIFEYVWNPEGMIAGDYLIQWSWQDNEKLQSNNFKFSLSGESSFPKPYTNIVNTINKYNTLFKRYTPPCVSEYMLSANDITPQVINFLNKGIGNELAFLENALNNLTEIYDSNYGNDFILNLLSSFLGRKLKGDNNILWKRQVKNAITLGKKKGTIEGLREALEEINVVLKKVTNLWQIRSEYYETEFFKVEENYFELKKIPLDEIKISIKKDKVYENIDIEKFDLLDSLENLGKKALVSKDELDGKFLKIRYKYREVPSDRKLLEDYIDSLPLMDNRDETLQDYPIKNWNVKLLEENDPLFDVLIPEREAFFDPIVYGKKRTIFLFSENIYNMDSYNGSLRNSYLPCDIDKNFIDNCIYGRSSKYNLDIEIKNMSSDRINEVKGVIKEFTPFHSNLNQLNASGKNKDYISVNDSLTININREIEEIDSFDFEDTILCKIEYNNGNSQLLNVLTGDLL